MNIVMVVWTESSSFQLFVLIMLLGIAFSVVGQLSCLSPLTVWAFLVLGTVSTTLWLKLHLPSVSLALYFLVSVMGSLFFVLSSSLLWPSTIICCLALLLLLGYSPFHFWVLKVLSHLQLFPLFLFLGPMKVGYLWLFFLSFGTHWWLGLLPLCLGVVIIFLSTGLSLVLFSSGSVQVILLLFMDSTFFVLFYSIYVCSILALALSAFSYISAFIGLMFMIGLPPLGMFWANLAALISLPFPGCLILLSTSSFTLVPYLSLALCSKFAAPSSMSYLSLLVTLPVALFAFFILIVL